MDTGRTPPHDGRLTHRQDGLRRQADHLETNVTDQQLVLGADHADTLTSRNNLACAYQAAGDLGRAIPLLEQTLTNRQRLLGADHPATLTSRNNLAYAYRAVNDLGDAPRL